MDWTATILSFAGGKPDPKFRLDGMDVSQMLTGTKKTSTGHCIGGYSNVSKIKPYATVNGNGCKTKKEMSTYLI
jgi:hypothetical protein